MNHEDAIGYMMQVARRSTCPTRQAGAVLWDPVTDHRVSGYEGAARGLGHCTTLGCRLDEEHECTRAVPAEVNALLQGARNQLYLFNCVLYISQPLRRASVGILINAGVGRIHYAGVLPADIQGMLADANVMFERLAPELLDRYGYEHVPEV